MNLRTSRGSAWRRRRAAGGFLLGACLGAAAQSDGILHESFESYPAGQTFHGSNGWSAANPAAAVVTEDPAAADALLAWRGDHAAGYPLPDASHTRMARVDTLVSNRFDAAGESSLWFDLMVAPDAWTQPTPPTILPGQLCAFFVTENGDLMAARASSPEPDATNRWMELEGVAVHTSGWMRLSVHVVQSPETAFYAVRVNGGPPVSRTDGLAAPATGGAAGGPWFPCANAASRLAPSALTWSGGGVMDDVAVGGDGPSIASDAQAAALITPVYDHARGGVDPGVMITTTAGLSQAFFVTADPYFHIRAIETNGAPLDAYDFEAAPINRYEWVWNDIPAGAHVFRAGFAPDMAARDTPVWWLMAHGITQNLNQAVLDDPDGDTIPTWAEHLTGTDPTNETSFFRITESGIRDGTNYIAWTGGGDTGLPPYRIYRRTNLATGAWEPVGTRARTPNGATNIWWDPGAPPGAFYRLGVIP